MSRRWWPWSDESDDAPAAAVPVEPARGLDLGGVLEENRRAWRARALEADAIAEAAFRRYGRWVPVDVLLDMHNAIRPPRPAPLRPAVPVIPGPEG